MRRNLLGSYLVPISVVVHLILIGLVVIIIISGYLEEAMIASYQILSRSLFTIHSTINPM
jgi:hypothetical protein